jgi:prepilin-type N-terminal cleavage/methylation domain-containing protein
MLSTLRAPDEDAEGFTLVELLVVILIISILAAIAIPVYLHQRERALDATAKSDLNQISQFEEMYLEDNGSYGTLADLVGDNLAVGPSKGDTVWVVRYDGERSYCLKAQAAGSSHVWFYDSVGGGLQPSGSAACPVTTGGTPGDSRTG